jgi:PAS domain S-box-containing protein
MSENKCNFEIDLDVLNAMTPFVLAVDGEMTVTWASPSILMRFSDALGRKVSELIEFDEPFEEVTVQSITEYEGKHRKLALLDGDPPTPLAGRWIASRTDNRSSTGQAATKYVLMARPDIRDRKELDLVLLSFDDFPRDGYLIDLLLTRDEYSVTLRDAQSAIQTLKEWKRDVEISRRRAERARARRRIEASASVQPQAGPPPAEASAASEPAPVNPDGRAQPLPSVGATAIFSVDLERTITSINEAFSTVTGLDAGDAVGQKCDILCLESCRDNCLLFREGWDEPVAQGLCQIKTKNGRLLQVVRNAETIRDESGCVTGGMESLVDVTDLIRELESTAESPDEAKSSDLDSKAGEIGASVVDILEMADMILEGDIAPEQRENLELVKDSAESLRSMLEEVLELPQAERERASAVGSNSVEIGSDRPDAAVQPREEENGEQSDSDGRDVNPFHVQIEDRLRKFDRLAPPGRAAPIGSDSESMRKREPEKAEASEEADQPEPMAEPEVEEASAEAGQPAPAVEPALEEASEEIEILEPIAEPEPEEVSAEVEQPEPIAESEPEEISTEVEQPEPIAELEGEEESEGAGNSEAVSESELDEVPVDAEQLEDVSEPEPVDEKVEATAPVLEIEIEGEAFDRKTALSHFNDDTELLSDVAGVFLEELPRKLSELREAVSQGDGKRLMTGAETVRSTAGAVGAARVLNCAQHLRVMGHNGDLTHAEKVCAVLEEEINEFRRVLEEAFTEKEEPQKA